MRTLSVFGFLFLALSLIGLPAGAQTPDGETTVNEGVCDELMADGTTKGLYGLCVAFCEAQDCGASLDEATGELTFDESCRPSNPKLLANYNKRKTSSDPDMPCVNVVANGCPCWTQSELEGVGTGSPKKGFCTIYKSFALTQLVGIDVLDDVTEYAIVTGGSEFHCALGTRSPDVIIRQQRIAEDTFMVCQRSLATECAARGF